MSTTVASIKIALVTHTLRIRTSVKSLTKYAYRLSSLRSCALTSSAGIAESRSQDPAPRHRQRCVFTHCLDQCSVELTVPSGGITNTPDPPPILRAVRRICPIPILQDRPRRQTAVPGDHRLMGPRRRVQDLAEIRGSRTHHGHNRLPPHIGGNPNPYRSLHVPWLHG